MAASANADRAVLGGESSSIFSDRCRSRLVRSDSDRYVIDATGIELFDFCHGWGNI